MNRPLKESTSPFYAGGQCFTPEAIPHVACRRCLLLSNGAGLSIRLDWTTGIWSNGKIGQGKPNKHDQNCLLRSDGGHLEALSTWTTLPWPHDFTIKVTKVMGNHPGKDFDPKNKPNRMTPVPRESLSKLGAAQWRTPR